MDELTIDDKKYISSKHAAKITGYAKDYVGQLCREGRVEARLVGRSWYVLEDSIREHRYGEEVKNTNKDSGLEETNAPEVRQSAPQVTYTTEEPAYLPELEVKETEEVVPEAPESPRTSVSSVTDMQSVWKEWFDTRQINSLHEDFEEQPDIESEESIKETGNDIYEEVANEEQVPIQRSYIGHNAELSREQEEWSDQSKIIPQRKEGGARKMRFIGLPPMTNVIIRAALIGCIILVTGFTAIVTGVGDKYITGGSSVGASILAAVSGVIYIDNVSK